eukprot:scaffold106373_cov31-Tisochrysis_lutea.AAC.1
MVHYCVSPTTTTTTTHAANRCQAPSARRSTWTYVTTIHYTHTRPDDGPLHYRPLHSRPGSWPAPQFPRRPPRRHPKPPPPHPCTTQPHRKK